MINIIYSRFIILFHAQAQPVVISTFLSLGVPLYLKTTLDPLGTQLGEPILGMLGMQLKSNFLHI